MTERVAPAGPMLTETPEEVEYELRAAEASLWTGSRLLIGVVGFAFAALAFAYFYLRSANNQGLWRPHGVTASAVIGTTVLGFTLGAAALAMFGNYRLRLGYRADWQVAGWVVVLGGFVAAGMQVWQLTRLGFYPGSSGYASCFVAWAVMNAGLLMSSSYWSETLLARALRLHRALSDEGAPAAVMPAQRLYNANSDGATLYWGFVAFIGLLFWFFFYVM
jgi:hypothetical protein